MEAKREGYFGDIYFRIFGQGEKTMLLLHGNGEDYSIFQPQIPLLAEHYQVVAMDSRGHGRSQLGEGGLTVGRIAQDVSQLLSFLEISQASLVGFSDGANAALKTALQAPKQVEAIVSVGANLDSSGVKRSVQLPVELGYRMTKLFAKWSKEAEKKSQILGLMVNQPNIRPEQLSKISCPVLVLAGEKDMIQESHTRLIAESLPNAQLKIYPGCGHFIFGQAETEVAEDILCFLNKVQ